MMKIVKFENKMLFLIILKRFKHIMHTLVSHYIVLSNMQQRYMTKLPLCSNIMMQQWSSDGINFSLSLSFSFKDNALRSSNICSCQTSYAIMFEEEFLFAVIWATKWIKIIFYRRNLMCSVISEGVWVRSCLKAFETSWT